MFTEAIFVFIILLLVGLFIFLGNKNKEGLINNSNTSNTSNTDTSNTSNTDTENISAESLLNIILNKLNENATPNSSLINYLDNYNHFNGSGSTVQLQNGAVFTDENGNTITVGTNSDGTQNLQIQLADANTSHVFNPTQSSVNGNKDNTFVSASGDVSAKAFTGSDGQPAIQVNHGKNTSLFLLPGSKQNINKNDISNTQYYGSTGYAINPTNYSTAYTATQSGQQMQQHSDYGNTYFSALPQGIPKSQIPPGHEDLYILKSQIVPPVCPVCPVCSGQTKTSSKSSASYGNGNGNDSINDSINDSKCTPCPPCARCPEPSFECKKVPNYKGMNNEYLPQPVLSDFSGFGM
jgi:hypothetical protein